ncbi:MAG: toprim domain-containing protein [Patescibacteria group bacterium]
MSNLDKLVTYFEKFPGIGGRQARRFAFHILRLPDADVQEISSLITNLKGSVVECSSCHRYFARSGGVATECSICTDSNRDRNKLLVLERDSDLQAIERSGTYDGLYFVLGGTVPLLNSDDTKKLRGGALRETVMARLPQGLSEIIMGFSVNPDGENTARYVEKIVSEVDESSAITISYLGRGLSTGSELEYADPETIKNALKNRH